MYTVVKWTSHLTEYPVTMKDARETCFSKRIERLQQTLSTRIWAIKKIGLTVDQGHSVVCAYVASSLFLLIKIS